MFAIPEPSLKFVKILCLENFCLYGILFVVVSLLLADLYLVAIACLSVAGGWLLLPISAHLITSDSCTPR